MMTKPSFLGDGMPERPPGNPALEFLAAVRNPRVAGWPGAGTAMILGVFTRLNDRGFAETR